MLALAPDQALLGEVTPAQGAGAVAHGQHDGLPPAVGGIVLAGEHQAVQANAIPQEFAGLAQLWGEGRLVGLRVGEGEADGIAGLDLAGEGLEAGEGLHGDDGDQGLAIGIELPFLKGGLEALEEVCGDRGVAPIAP